MLCAHFRSRYRLKSTKEKQKIKILENIRDNIKNSNEIKNFYEVDIKYFPVKQQDEKTTEYLKSDEYKDIERELRETWGEDYVNKIIEEEQIPEETTEEVTEDEPIENEPEIQSDIMKKFDELKNQINRICEIQKTEADEFFEII